MRTYLCCLFLLTFNTYATTVWQCSAEDNQHQTWMGEGQYQIKAVNLAYDACKKQSKDPESCHTSKEGCDAMVNGRSTKPLWTCVALDLMASAWTSNPYPQRDDAAIAAQDYCKDKSGYPDSCYVNLITCKNMNEDNS